MELQTIQEDVDERTNLTSSNKFELLLFRLGCNPKSDQSELFGINVFKIREIVAMPTMTKIAGSLPNVLGVVNLRGKIIPVIDLPSLIGCTPKTGLNIMLVTEFARTTQAFAVESVEDIVRLDWKQVLSAENNVSSDLITSIAKLDVDKENSKLIQVLDVETILREINPQRETDKTEKKKIILKEGTIVLAADDSIIARTLIQNALESMGISYIMTKTGKEALDKLNSMNTLAISEGKTIYDKVALVLSDLEMPEMDGFTLTKNIKSSSHFKDLPVIIHSSLTGSANEIHVKSIGADAYVAKFVESELAEVIQEVLLKFNKTH